MPFWKRADDSLEDLQEKNEILQVKARNEELQLTIAQKKAALQRLKAAGLTTSSFGGSWAKILQWLKTH